MEKQKITVVALGAGNRMNTYAAYAKSHPDELTMVAVVEPDEWRRQHFARQYQIPDTACFADWRDFFCREKMADAVFVCTPDNEHYEPTLKALERGYDVLLEKPIAQSWRQCLDIVECARKNGRMVAVCHVLRFHPYFLKLREVVRRGSLGELISVNHIENVGIERMTHAFVRGLWRKESETNPMILSKACHDLDLLVWLTGRKCLDVSSYGSLKWFRKENAPQGSTLRCIDGCAVESVCPYSAVDLYLRRKRWLRHFNVASDRNIEDIISDELHTGPYGRCVYHCDNDVVDHQVVIMQMEEGVTVTFSMEGFTKEPSRKTHVMCSYGEVFGDERQLTVRYFQAHRPDEVFDFSSVAGECNYHGGADLSIVANFVEALQKRDESLLLTDIESSLESHRIAFEIERKRLS